MSERDDERIPSEDVDDVIEIASDIARRDEEVEDSVSRKEMVDIGEQLGLESDDVEEAIDELADREHDEAVRAVKRKRMLVLGGLAAGAVAVLVLMAALIGRSGLESAKAGVDKQRAQVVNVLDRQANVRARLEGKPLNDDRDAELSGAENRVSIEKRRYDEAAAKYNHKADSFPGKWGAALFGWPDRVPLSSEIEKW